MYVAKGGHTMKTYEVIRGDGRLVRVTVPREEAEETWCEVCEEADGEPLTVPTPDWPFRACSVCAEGFDEIEADDPEGAAMMVDLAAIRRFGATAFDRAPDPSSALDGKARP
jgi:hypothetical protein